MTYKFPDFKTEIVDPTVEINPIVREVNPIALTINVEVTLITTNGSKFGLNLENVTVENLNYDSTTLTERVMDKLAEYAV